MIYGETNRIMERHLMKFAAKMYPQGTIYIPEYDNKKARTLSTSNGIFTIQDHGMSMKQDGSDGFICFEGKWAEIVGKE